MITYTARDAQLARLASVINTNIELRQVLEQIADVKGSQGYYECNSKLRYETISYLKQLGYRVQPSQITKNTVIEWDELPIEDYFYNKQNSLSVNKELQSGKRRQVTIIILCIVIIILLLLLSVTSFWFVFTKQIGLVALVDVPGHSFEIPDYDPDADIVTKEDYTPVLNDKLELGKMCINMTSRVTFDNAYSKGFVNIVNEEINNYPQFVTLILDSNGVEIYQSGLIPVGKGIRYAQLDVVLPAGTYDCTAVFVQVDTDKNVMCGQAAAKVKVVVENK